MGVHWGSGRGKLKEKRGGGLDLRATMAMAAPALAGGGTSSARQWLRRPCPSRGRDGQRASAPAKSGGEDKAKWF